MTVQDFYMQKMLLFLKKFSLKTSDSLYVFTVDSMALKAWGIMNLKGL